MNNDIIELQISDDTLSELKDVQEELLAMKDLQQAITNHIDRHRESINQIEEKTSKALNNTEISELNLKNRGKTLIVIATGIGAGIIMFPVAHIIGIGLLASSMLSGLSGLTAGAVAYATTKN